MKNKSKKFLIQNSKELFLLTFELFLFCLFCLLPTAYCFSQDIHFSQFYMNPLAMNPANAGADRNEMQAILNYKDQWRSVASPYKTIALSCDKRIQKKKSAMDFWAVGINFFNDKAGDINMKTFQANISAAYHHYLSKEKYSSVGVGLQTGFAQRSISYDAVTWGNQFDGNSYNPFLPTGEPASGTSYAYGDFLSTGVLYSYNNTSGRIKVTDNHELKVNLGFSVFHITQPKYSFYESGEKIYMKYVLHGNALLSVPNTNIAFAPGFMYFRQGPAQEIYPGTLIRYKLRQASKYTGYYKSMAISVGAFLRMKDAIAPVVLFENAGYSIGLSYDVNVSDLKVASTGRGGFEISLKYQMPVRAIYGSRSKF
ncbi:MAG: PorP/SprF family type IX secretion system membrane protein [Bacteroidetes bacterium]|nr:PorP/SprF family type IX secretion system membrane protein [Bacteroidota bacterium]